MRCADYLLAMLQPKATSKYLDDCPSTGLTFWICLFVLFCHCQIHGVILGGARK